LKSGILCLAVVDCFAAAASLDFDGPCFRGELLKAL
jgi:hypothetical protein